jgi:hypothetical protein
MGTNPLLGKLPDPWETDENNNNSFSQTQVKEEKTKSKINIFNQPEKYSVQIPKEKRYLGFVS